MKRSIIVVSVFIGLIIAGLMGPTTEKVSAAANDFAVETCDTVDLGDWDKIITCTGAVIVDRNMWGQDITMGPDGYLYVGTYWDVGVGDFDAWYMIDLTSGAIVDSFGTGVAGIASVVDGEFVGVAIPPGGDTLVAPRGAAWTASGDTMYTADFDGQCVKQWVKDTGGHWVYESTFLDADGGAPHGVQVDPNGRIWVTFYYATDTLYSATDTVNAGGLRVYEPDGTEASFSPVNIVTVGATLDTIPTANRGLTSDNAGNILLSGGNKVLYRIDYATGLTATIHDELTNSSLTKAGVDAAGFIYIGYVGSGQPLTILDDDLALYAIVEDTVTVLSRSVVVSASGNDVYTGAIYSGMNGVRSYHSDAGVNGTYTVSDTLGTIFHFGTSVDTILSIRPDVAAVPTGYVLSQNFPNPFNPQTMIAFEVPAAQMATLIVYDLLGHQVRSLVNAVITPGEYRIVWDGRSDSGMRVASGVYLYRLQTNQVTLSKRMLFLK